MVTVRLDAIKLQLRVGFDEVEMRSDLEEQHRQGIAHNKWRQRYLLNRPISFIGNAHSSPFPPRIKLNLVDVGRDNRTWC